MGPAGNQGGQKAELMVEMDVARMWCQDQRRVEIPNERTQPAVQIGMRILRQFSGRKIEPVGLRNAQMGVRGCGFFANLVDLLG